MFVRFLLIVGILSQVVSNVLAQSATVTNTSIFCETQNQTADKYVSWSGTWTGIGGWFGDYDVVGCYAPVYNTSPTTFYSPGPAIDVGTWSQPAPTSDPGTSSGTESPIVPIDGPDGGTLQGVYVWWEYGEWTPTNGHYYWHSEGQLCDWVWIANPGGGCFAAGTMVLTPVGYKPIEYLKAGDSVVSTRRANPGAKQVARRIRSVSSHLDRLIDVTANGRTVRTTFNHPFYTRSKGWVSAGALQIGDELLGDDKSWSSIETIRLRNGATTSSVYNIEIDGESSYFVGGTDWGMSFCVADSCSALESRPERLAGTGKQSSRWVGSVAIESILQELTGAVPEGR